MRRLGAHDKARSGIHRWLRYDSAGFGAGGMGRRSDPALYATTRRPLLEAETLPPAAYTDAAFYDARWSGSFDASGCSLAEQT